MTSRDRLLAVLAGRLPDCVPASPDFSNMIPARLTGKPFWDLYLYKDPPIWEAYVACAKHFDIDALVDGYFPLKFPDPDEPDWREFIVERRGDMIVTRRSYTDGGKRVWSRTADVYHERNPRAYGMSLSNLHLPPVPERFEPVYPRREVDTGPEGFKRFKEMLGDQGLVGVSVVGSCAISTEEELFEYVDNPDKHEQWAAERVAAAEKKFRQVMAMDVKPDFICVGGSGTLVLQTVDIFRQLAFPAVKRAIELATAAGLPTHVHSCGPESKLVKIFAEETDLTVIDPLELPPMGDCNLAELKRLYGHKIVLKGNLHTTDVMLRGSAEDVAAAGRKAIDDAGAGGRFILSTGDQCGRDTPDENLRAMVETARTYGRY
jgi:uroporphyrinogen decarboxylase